MKKNAFRAIAVGAILLVLFHLIVFAVPFVHGPAFWVSYVFDLIAFAVTAVGVSISEFQGKGVKSRFYGFPILRIVVTYLAVQLAVSLIFMAAAVLLVWAEIIVYSLLLGAACIGLIAADAVREEIERQDVVQKKNTSTMMTLRSKAGTLPGLTDSFELAKALANLSESFRFSDPVSSEATEESERELGNLLDELQRALVDKDTDSAAALCTRTTLLLAERNRLCKLSKNG